MQAPSACRGRANRMRDKVVSACRTTRAPSTSCAPRRTPRACRLQIRLDQTGGGCPGRRTPCPALLATETGGSKSQRCDLPAASHLHRRCGAPLPRTAIRRTEDPLADCVVAGFRWYKDRDDTVGGRCCRACSTTACCTVGVTSAFMMPTRESLVAELALLRRTRWRQRAKPLEQRQGFRMEALAARARLRGPIRPFPRPLLSPRDHVSKSALRIAATTSWG